MLAPSIHIVMKYMKKIDREPSQIKCLLIGSLGFWVVGFTVGFVGPIIFMPSSNQGPLIGIFITGPLGFIIGGITGIVYWFYLKNRNRG